MGEDPCGMWVSDDGSRNCKYLREAIVKSSVPRISAGRRRELSGFGDVGKKSIERQKEHLKRFTVSSWAGSNVIPHKTTSAHHSQPKETRVLKQA